jgi:hypothetical protein
MKNFLSVIRLLAVYFIAFVLLSFGISKLMDVQFLSWNYLQFVPLRLLPGQSFAWAFLGHSRLYYDFIGFTEILAGLLLLFSRTRLMGLLLAAVLYINVVLIDIVFAVNDAIGHATAEFLIVLVLLAGYARDLKTFFWTRKGRMTTEAVHDNKWVALRFPLVFILLVVAGNIVFLQQLKAGEDKNLEGSYRLTGITIGKDTLACKPGKYTHEPLLFFEYDHTCIISVNDSVYVANYYSNGDSLLLHFQNKFQDIDSISGIIDRQHYRISGMANATQPVHIELERVKNTAL